MAQEIWDTALKRYLGNLLRQARKKRGWTPRQLVQLLDRNIGDHAITTYEQGTRTLSIIRFVELCAALDLRPGEVLDHAVRHATTNAGPVPVSGLAINVRALATTTVECLQPVRKWAELFLEQRSAAGRDILDLDSTTLRALAELTGMGLDELITALRRIPTHPLPGTSNSERN